MSSEQGRPTPPGPPSLKGRGEDDPSRVADVGESPSPSSPLPFREGGPGGVGSAARASKLPPPGQPVLRVRGVNHYFGTGDTRTQVLFDNTLEVMPGELVIMS